MTLVDVLVRVLAVVGALTLTGSIVIVGRPRLYTAAANTRRRTRSILPYLALLVGVLLVNKVARQVGPDVSWIIGWNITGTIFALEGGFVAWLQSFATPPLTAYFSAVYVYGYVFLLVFPLVAYFALADRRALRHLMLTYAINYSIGLILYVLFIAYGPRNLMPDMVQSLLYTSWPQSQLLTSQVNTNTNVFPSLHTSLSVSVAVLAHRTRAELPQWAPIAAVLALSVDVSTMYLGIHWGTDVVAGILLGVGSVLLASRLDKRIQTSELGLALDRRLVRLLRR
ncbi:phosphatase PAP2 family protein [Halarchaeum salinum]|uniref:Phosphatidic acid phosphatase type 2/haloperoxidase domain-containing protein n=1 Tax=Halarchaeum salinum TaxID=489912 RepID=A0AAV3S4M7_9EURY